MCARIFYLLLAALFVFLVVTVAAFKYLEWWQAMLASAATFGLLVVGCKYLIRSILGNFGNMFKGMFDVKSKVLRNATADIHSVRRVEMPAEMAADDDEPSADDERDEEDGPPPPRPQDMHWYRIEFTLFPDPKSEGQMRHWDFDDLTLVPFDAKVSAGLDDEDDDGDVVTVTEQRLVHEGAEVTPEGSKFHGPQRVVVTAGVPSGVRVLKFRYYFESFGRVELPAALGLPPARK